MNVNESLAKLFQRFAVRPRGSINEGVKIRGSIAVCLTDARTGRKRIFERKNIVTDAGDLFYSERSVKTAIPTNFVDGSGDFDGIMELYSGASAAPAKANDRGDMVTLITGSAKAMDATYPKINDDDTDNPGRAVDIVTYRVSYLTSEANDANIADVILTNPAPGATEPLLQQAEFTPFAKTSSDTLKVWVNHQPLGV
jgi:hypothetical protein